MTVSSFSPKMSPSLFIYESSNNAGEYGMSCITQHSLICTAYQISCSIFATLCNERVFVWGETTKKDATTAIIVNRSNSASTETKKQNTGVKGTRDWFGINWKESHHSGFITRPIILYDCELCILNKHPRDPNNTDIEWLHFALLQIIHRCTLPNGLQQSNFFTPQENWRAKLAIYSLLSIAGHNGLVKLIIFVVVPSIYNIPRVLKCVEDKYKQAYSLCKSSTYTVMEMYAQGRSGSWEKTINNRLWKTEIFRAWWSNPVSV